METLGEKIKNLRKQKNMTQAELASILYVSRSLVAKYETDRINVDKETLEKIASCFNVDISYFISEEINSTLINETNRLINYLFKAFFIFVILLSISFLLIIVLPIFQYSTYIYDGVNVPTHLYGNISLITACFKKNNYVALFSLISIIINISLSFTLLFLNRGKIFTTLNIINVIFLITSIILFILTFAYGVNYMSMVDFSMNTKEAFL